MWDTLSHGKKRFAGGLGILATIRQTITIPVIPAAPTWSYRQLAGIFGVGRGTLFRAAERCGLDTSRRAGVEEVRVLADRFGVEVEFRDGEAA
jgi:hypothetical protein